MLKILKCFHIYCFWQATYGFFTIGYCSIVLIIFLLVNSLNIYYSVLGLGSDVCSSHLWSLKWLHLDLGGGLRQLNISLSKIIEMTSYSYGWHLGYNGWSSGACRASFSTPLLLVASMGFVSAGQFQSNHATYMGAVSCQTIVPRDEDRNCKASGFTWALLLPYSIGYLWPAQIHGKRTTQEDE